MFEGETMKTPRVRLAAGALLAAVLLSSTGCWTNYGFNVGAFGVPVPVSPYFQDEFEDEFWQHERYDRVPILGPVTSGSEPVALDPPTPDEVIRALEKARPVEGGLPFLYEVQRNNVQMVIDPIADYMDPPRVYPLVGPAQLHHAHYKCTIYFTEITRVGWPIPYTTVDEDTVEVVYIDHNHLHMVGNVTDGPSGNY